VIQVNDPTNFMGGYVLPFAGIATLSQYGPPPGSIDFAGGAGGFAPVVVVDEDGVFGISVGITTGMVAGPVTGLMLQITFEVVAGDAGAPGMIFARGIADFPDVALLDKLGAMGTTYDPDAFFSLTVDVADGAAAMDADLAGLSLTVPAAALTPAFAAGTIAYTADAVAGTTQITVTGTTADANATLTIDGVGAVSGVGSVVAVGVGANAIDVVVTAEDGVTTKTYTVTLTVAAPASMDLPRHRSSASRSRPSSSPSP